MSADRVLLTGASGFIAKHIAAVLLGSGWAVRGTTRSFSKGESVVASLGAAGLDISLLELVQANLDSDEGWMAAAQGCRYVIHTASPFPRLQPSHPEALVETARGGTLRVLEAARRSGAERVVMTSSVIAAYNGRGDILYRPVREDDWSNPNGKGAFPYAISKTLAERAAWAYSREHDLPLSVVNPAFVLGPLLDTDLGASVGLVRSMMKGHVPAVPNAAFGIVDVRDVAEAHLRAMTGKGAVGRRFFLSGGARSLKEIGEAIADAVPDLRGRVPRFVVPDLVVRAVATMSRQVRPLVPELGRTKSFDCTPAREVLDLDLRSADEAIASTARSLREKRLA